MRPTDKFSRYARFALQHPCRWMAIMDLAIRHFPANLRQYACDRIMLRMTEMEYGK